MNGAHPEARGLEVAVRDLRKSFGELEVLKGITFNVAAGEIFVIMGPSGSGKSVLLRQIIGLDKPDSGEILIGGEPIPGEEVTARHRLAMVFQSGALLNSLTVEENVGLYLSEHRLKSREEIRRAVREKLELVGLEGVEEKFPSELSGGMKKRVAIARALIVEPQLLLYDEPTSELDPIFAVTIADEIRALNERIGATSVVVSHDRDLAFGIAHRMAIMRDGRLLFVGTPEEMRAFPDEQVQDFLNADFSKQPKRL